MADFSGIVTAVGNLQVKRTVGIEMEGVIDFDTKTSEVDDNMPSGWLAKLDGSFDYDKENGIEINSPKMNDLNDIHTGWAVMQQHGFHHSETAGTHVHVEIKDFTVGEVFKLWWFSQRIEKLMFALQQDYRWQNRWCRVGESVRCKFNRILPLLDEVSQDKLNADWWNPLCPRNISLEFYEIQEALFEKINGRYVNNGGGVNHEGNDLPWCRMRGYGTVEMRLFGCVESAEEAIAYCLLAHGVVELVKNTTTEQLAYIENEIMTSESPEQAAEKLFQAIGLPTYPLQGSRAKEALSLKLNEKRRIRPQAV